MNVNVILYQSAGATLSVIEDGKRVQIDTLDGDCSMSVATFRELFDEIVHQGAHGGMMWQLARVPHIEAARLPIEPQGR